MSRREAQAGFNVHASVPDAASSPLVPPPEVDPKTRRARADDTALTMKEMRATLDELGQGHLFAQWSEAGDSAAKANEARFFEQMAALDASYPGGLKAYVANARQLLAESKSGVNPLEGWTPKVPTGTSLRFASAEYLEHEQVRPSTSGIALDSGIADWLVGWRAGRPTDWLPVRSTD